MNIKHVSKSLLPTVLLFASVAAFAQKSTKGAVWKKEVSREINMQMKEDVKVHHLKDVSGDTTLLEMIVNAIKAGKVTAYSNFDHSFTTKLTVKELNDIMIPKPDTATLTDPVTGTEVTKIIMHDFNYDAVHKYRILEEWTFNPSTGNTDIHIAGVAPIKEIFSDGDFRGTQAVFWVRYNEILPVLEHYEQLHPSDALALRIWDDYFLSDVKPGEKK